ncbi:MAG: hypothetical protein ACQCN4_11445 [Candidatus Bathyarchaeia archaeon]|jgi:hypothetical protein
MNTVIAKRILQSLLDKQIIGAKHTSEDNAIKCLPKDARGDAKKILKKLEKEGFVMYHPTSYDRQISLNPTRIKEIQEFLKS